ncbi:hypothetical protein KL905_001534 [Ogataea polymorpha]|nr:hypothetical protein KL935_000598 [Ogataea polymorpha]KAG7912327.1 hypothetical protein KL906_000531 [Ogataea polymorpha]KAG7919911.1 hypothetical protein KL927_000591 [Ogataea polymorpha]KAG7923268.1 hypothetical protein KL905_001534 [Ogataea polymorpha]
MAPSVLVQPATLSNAGLKNAWGSVSDFPSHAESLLGATLLSKVQSIDHNTCEPDELDPFFVCDLGELKRLVGLWRTEMPRVEPFYAVKCNNDEKLLCTLLQMGLGFDCASKTEIQQMLSLGADPTKIIYANPCKAVPHLRYARQNGVNLTTVDSVDEVRKIAAHHPDCGLLIRIHTDDADATCPLSIKFGASLQEARVLVQECARLKLNLKGVAFHVGSGCKNFNTIETAVRDSRMVFDYAASLGYSLKMLDIGGGFSKPTFHASAAVFRSALDTHFAAEEFPDLYIFSELGRFLAASCFTLAVNVTSKRSDAFQERIYVNDGVYGNLNCILFDHQEVEPKVLTSHGRFVFHSNYNHPEKELAAAANPFKQYSLWGPTCDGLDCISPNCKLSQEVVAGDWLYFKDTGAYTSAAATNFNGFGTNSECLYIDSYQ